MTRAAARLRIAQPALSHAIGQLEEQLGIALLERHARGVSLTEAGRVFLVRARAVIAAEDAALAAAASLARAAGASLQIGFLSTPPVSAAPRLFSRFGELRPHAQLSFQQLAFPWGTTADWLEPVDAALCFSPTPHPDVHIQPLWEESRVVLMPASHALAESEALTVADVIDETFYGYNREAERGWSGMWRLEDHRRGRRARMTSDEPTNTLELVAAVASGAALIALSRSAAEAIASVLRNIVAIPLVDATPAVFSLVSRVESGNPLLEALIAEAARLGPESALDP